MKSESVDQWGDQRRLWCTSNILSWPECYRRNQYTLPSSWQQRMYSLWHMQTTRQRMQLKDLRMVTTTLESTFLLTMESTHKHAMRLQASQPVAPPAILPPPCFAENELYENSFPLLTHHCLVCIWQKPWAWLLGWGWWCLQVVCFFCDVWVFSTQRWYINRCSAGITDVPPRWRFVHQNFRCRTIPHTSCIPVLGRFSICS